MMYNKKIIKDSYPVILDKDYIIVSRDKELITIEYFSKSILQWNKVVKVETEFHTVSIWGYETECFLVYNEQIDVIDKSTGELKKTYKIKGINSFNENYFINVEKRKDGNKRNVELYQIKDDLILVKKVEKVDKARYFNIDRELFSSSKNDIKSYSKNLWQRSYASLTGVEQNNVSSTILENNAKLYLPISSEGRSGLFVLDIATGEEVAFYERAIGFLVKDKQYIYTYKGDFCILKINTQTNKVEEIPLKEVLLSNGFNPNSDLRRSTVKDNNVYFTQFLGTPNSKLGIINLDTKEMLYTYDFAEENGLIGSIEVSNGRVFVHTQDNTLHIFEREE